MDTENKDNESLLTDSQETFYDKSQPANESQMLTESQDFALVVNEDSDESTKSQSQGVRDVVDSEKNKKQPVETNVVEAETEGNNDNSTRCDIAKETLDILTQVGETKREEIDDKLNIEDYNEDAISGDKRGSDEDDIIQGTPPEITSPSRKLLSGKRKGESLDEPVSKIQRTLPQRDALKLEKENLATRIGKGCIDYKSILSNVTVQGSDTESDILCQNTEYFDKNEILAPDTCLTQSLPRNVIIEETQDSEDSEPIIFGNTSDNEKGTEKDKSEESGEKTEGLDQPNSQSDSTNAKPLESKTEDPPLNKQEDSQPSKEQDAQPVIEEDPQTSKEKNPKPSVEEDSKVNEQEGSPQPIEKVVSKPPSTNTNGETDENKAEDNKANEVMDVSEQDVTDNQISTADKSVEKKDEGVCSTDKNWLNTALPSSDSASDSNCEAGSNSSNKSRKSVELIYDRKSASQEKNKIVELVKIDEEGEEIILDSSTEDLLLRFSTGSSNNSPQNTTLYKSCIEGKTNSESSYKSTVWNESSKRNDATEKSDCQLTNGDNERTISDTTKTISSGSDQLVEDLLPDAINAEISKSVANDSDVVEGYSSSLKLSETMELANIVSDSEGDSLLLNENVHNKSQDKANTSATAAKTTAYEKRIRFHVELKYLVHVDDITKEIVSKEVTDVHCEPLIENSAAGRNDTSGSLGDISGNANRDTSPGSVISNAQPFPLPMSRFSITSTISSSSSASSAASLAMKLRKDVNFSLPKGRAKHARRPAIEAVLEEKLELSENFEKLTQGWKNGHTIMETVLQTANMVITSPEIFQQDTEHNKSEDKVLSSTPEPQPIKKKVLSSTPEPVVQDERVTSQLATPKSTKNNKPLKRSRAKSNSSTRSNGMRKASPEVISTSQEDRIPLAKRKRENIDTVEAEKVTLLTSNISTPNRLRSDTPRKEALRSLTPQNIPNDELVGKIVFAKWSDNNYYPGEVTEKTKGKFRVKFYDGKSKLLIEEFLIPMPELLRDGLSVYATTKEDDYGSIGIILQSEEVNNVIFYTIEMDDGTRVKVQTKDIFLMPGQAQILKEEVEIESKSIPKTPQHSDGVSLDNLIDWKRRQPVTPTVSTPKTRKKSSPRTSRNTDSIPASGSGISNVKEKAKEISSSSESESKTSDSNISSIEDVDGVQPELVTLPAAQISKGPQSRMKGRGRSKSKQNQNDLELGPIPPATSTIFKNMSFILTSTSSDIIPRHRTDDSCSETGTENEEEWLKTPFIKDRVKMQLINGGGTVYDSFKSIPPNEYKNTKLITNAPNLTAKSIQCLSVGISVYRHVWVIQCCRENKTLKPSRFELPTGWSLEKKMYIESYDRINKEPFNGMIIGMPMLDNKNAANRSIQFWRRICENAGAKVQIIDDTENDFSHATAILTDNRCPSWLVEKADSWEIPLVSTVWIVQCIIAGRSLSADTHPQYKHTFIQS